MHAMNHHGMNRAWRRIQGMLPWTRRRAWQRRRAQATACARGIIAAFAAILAEQAGVDHWVARRLVHTALIGAALRRSAPDDAGRERIIQALAAHGWTRENLPFPFVGIAVLFKTSSDALH